ncbi:MAG: hypothetical protein K6F79_06365 [Saccharofermentans sp.]|nr:hypothetical protein [Saccharofermentans sp.]
MITHRAPDIPLESIFCSSRRAFIRTILTINNPVLMTLIAVALNMSGIVVFICYKKLMSTNITPDISLGHILCPL